MRNSPRFLNRFLLFLAGVLFLALGALFILYRAVPQTSDIWGSVAAKVKDFLAKTAQPFVFDMPFHWIWLAVFALLIIAVLVSLSLMFNQGGGRGSAVAKVNSKNKLKGFAVIDPRFTQDLLRAKFDGDPDVLRISVSGRDIKRKQVAKIDAQLRRGADLVIVIDKLREAVKQVEGVTGVATPTVIELTSGIKTALHSKQRVR